MFDTRLARVRPVFWFESISARMDFIPARSDRLLTIDGNTLPHEVYGKCFPVFLCIYTFL